MRLPVPLVIALLLLALAGWAFSDDGDTALRDRVRSLEARLAAMEGEGQAPGRTDTLRARRLIIEDGQGRERALLEASDHDAPRLILRDTKGTRRLHLGVDTRGEARLLLFDAAEQQRLGIQLSRGEEPHITLRAARPNPRQLTLSVSNERTVGLRMWGGPGKQNETSHAAFCIWHDGTISFGGGLRSADRSGFYLQYPREGDPKFEFRDGAQDLLWRLPIPE